MAHEDPAQAAYQHRTVRRPSRVPRLGDTMGPLHRARDDRVFHAPVPHRTTRHAENASPRQSPGGSIRPPLDKKDLDMLRPATDAPAARLPEGPVRPHPPP